MADHDLTIEMLEQIESIPERIRILAQYVKCINQNLQDIQDQYPHSYQGILSAIRELEYILKGANGSDSGLRGQMERHIKRIQLLEDKVATLSENYVSFRNEFKVFMAKVAIGVSIFLLFASKLIDKFL